MLLVAAVLLACIAAPAAAFSGAAPGLAPRAHGTRRPPCASRAPALRCARARMSSSEEWVQHDVLANKMGVLTLDRPKALNAADKSVTGTCSLLCRASASLEKLPWRARAAEQR